MQKLYPEEILEIQEAMNRNLEIYLENLNDYKKWNKTKSDGFMSKFDQEECDKQIKFYMDKINLVHKIKTKIGFIR